VAIGMRIAREAFDAKGKEYTETKLPIHSILDEGKSQGITPDQLSNQLKLSILMIRKIDLRNILYSTIPLNLIESLAQTIKRNVREVARYLSGQSVIPETVRYKSSQTPKVTEQKKFFDEIRKDTTLNEEQRDYWLSYEEKE
jgi:GMP synthase PP-ATPase subunit